MKPSIALLSAIAVVLIGTAPVLADWVPGDPFKMHYPQLPDPLGWDIAWYSGQTQLALADDWQCSETGYVDDIHFWYSVKGDEGHHMGYLTVRIYDDDRSGPFSKPGALRWEDTFLVSLYPWVHEEDFGDQGWYDPNEGYCVEHDHNDVFQLNIVDIDNPFWQEAGNIYWLELSATSNSQNIGWKTSLDHFEDDAVWSIYDPAGAQQWSELIDPVTYESLDLAFVITPEPATLAVLAVGGLVLMRRRRK